MSKRNLNELIGWVVQYSSAGDFHSWPLSDTEQIEIDLNEACVGQGTMISADAAVVIVAVRRLLVERKKMLTCDIETPIGKREFHRGFGRCEILESFLLERMGAARVLANVIKKKKSARNTTGKA